MTYLVALCIEVTSRLGLGMGVMGGTGNKKIAPARARLFRQ